MCNDFNHDIRGSYEIGLILKQQWPLKKSMDCEKIFIPTLLTGMANRFDKKYCVTKSSDREKLLIPTFLQDGGEEI